MGEVESEITLGSNIKCLCRSIKFSSKKFYFIVIFSRNEVKKDLTILFISRCDPFRTRRNLTFHYSIINTSIGRTKEHKCLYVNPPEGFTTGVVSCRGTRRSDGKSTRRTERMGR